MYNCNILLPVKYNLIEFLFLFILHINLDSSIKRVQLDSEYYQHHLSNAKSKYRGRGLWLLIQNNTLTQHYHLYMTLNANKTKFRTEKWQINIIIYKKGNQHIAPNYPEHIMSTFNLIIYLKNIKQKHKVSEIPITGYSVCISSDSQKNK